MREYLELLEKVYRHGKDRSDRTGVGTRSLFGTQTRYRLDAGFPLLTTKKIHWKSVVHELLWFLRGDTAIRTLNASGVHIWDEWATEDGELGPIYGAQWTRWKTPDGREINQMDELIRGIREKPYSRRHLVTAWNPSDLPDESKSPALNAAEGRMALAPCHVLMQFYVYEDGFLSCQLYQRSGDLFLGVPFNIASYALLTHLVAHVTGLKPLELIHTLGDVHLYRNHFQQVEEQLSRSPRPQPSLRIMRSVSRLQDFTFDDLVLEGYHPHPAIKAPIAI